MGWLERISIVEALVIRLGGLILILLFISKAIVHEWHGLIAAIFAP